MDVTLLGMEMDFSEVQLEKAAAPIDVTLLGMERDLSEVQLENAPSPMDVTLLGMERDSRAVQSENAPPAMDVMLSKSDISFASVGHLTRVVASFVYTIPSIEAK